MKSHSKGISPLLASVLLIAVTVAIATLTAGWVSTTVRTTQTTITNKTTEAVDCSAAAITIQGVYFHASEGGSLSNGTAKAIVRNSGMTDDLTIAAVTFYNVSGGAFSGGTIRGPVTPVSNFDKGNAEVFNVSGTAVGASGFVGATCPNDFSKVVVTTSCGGVSAIWDRTPVCY